MRKKNNRGLKKCKMCMHNHRRAAVQKVSLSLIYIYIFVYILYLYTNLYAYTHSLSVRRWSKNGLHFTVLHFNR